jgi:hypothetical protein
MRTEIIRQASFCINYADAPLWYSHYDGNASFDKFVYTAFGRWKKYNVEKYRETKKLCGADVNYSYFP